MNAFSPSLSQLPFIHTNEERKATITCEGNTNCLPWANIVSSALVYKCPSLAVIQQTRILSSLSRAFECMRGCTKYNKCTLSLSYASYLSTLHLFKKFFVPSFLQSFPTFVIGLISMTRNILIN